MTTTPITLGYWNARGRAQYTRITAAYLGIEVNEVHPETPEAWEEQKSALGLDFPNLPYIIDGDYKLTESHAIPVYLALRAERKDLFGSNPQEAARVAQIKGLWYDILLGIAVAYFNSPTLDAAKAAMEGAGKSIAPKIQTFAEWAGDGWLVGDNLTYADIITNVEYDFITALYAKIGLESPLGPLTAYNQRFREVPGIKEYLAQETRSFLPAKTPISPELFF